MARMTFVPEISIEKKVFYSKSFNMQQWNLKNDRFYNKH